MKRSIWDACMLKLERTSELDDALLPLYHQNGAWFGGDVEPPSHLGLLKASTVPPERITRTNENGESVLQTTFCHFGTEDINIEYDHVEGKIVCPATKSLNAPNLKTAGIIRAENAREIRLPSLRKCTSLTAPKANQLEISEIETIGDLKISSLLIKLNLPKLETIGDLDAMQVANANLPALRHAGQLDLRCSIDTLLPELLTVEKNLILSSTQEAQLGNLCETGGEIAVESAATVYLPRLEKARDLWANSATRIHAPMLKTVGTIDSQSAPNYKPAHKPQQRWAPHPQAKHNAVIREAARQETNKQPDLLI